MRIRITIYLLILLALSSAVNFHRLGEHHYYGDEGIYAYVGQNMEKSGDWLFFHSWDPHKPYLEKPPLYFWLVGLTKGLFADDETGNRFWSALFGVACVLLTCVLGARIFQLEIGFLAALMLALNQRFVFDHGARHGTMDTGVTLCGLVAMLLVWHAPTWRAWFLAGLCTGVISMLKGMPYGLLMLGLIGIHAVVYHEGRGFFSRIKGPLTGLAATLLFSLPWFVFQWIHFGDYIEQKHLRRLLGELHPDHVQGPFFYLESITHSSSPFYLFLPAMLAAAVLSIRGGKKNAFGLLFIVGGGWIAVCSASVSKLFWYIYPVYPLIALSIAAVLLYPLLGLVRRYAPKAVPVLAAASLAAVVPYALYTFHVLIPHYAGHVRDLRWEIYQSEAWKACPEARFALIESPKLEMDPFRDCYVDHHMQGIERVKTFKQVEAVRSWEGPLAAAVDRRAPDLLIRGLDRWFAEFEGTRYESPFHIVYVRGLEVHLPEELHVQARALNSYYLPLDREIPFNRHEVEAYLGPGWSAAEPEGRWTAAPNAMMRIHLKRVVPLQVTLKISTFRAQRIMVEMNGKALVTLEADSEVRTHSMVLPSTTLKAANELIFHFPDARSPAELGQGADPRKLGMRVISMRFEEGQSTGPLADDI